VSRPAKAHEVIEMAKKNRKGAKVVDPPATPKPPPQPVKK
jgi:hypothetical protein